MNWQPANVPIPPLPPGGFAGTEGTYIRNLINEVSATTYVEGIVVRLRAGTGGINPGPCQRQCGQYHNLDIRRELYDPAAVTDVRSVLFKLGLQPEAWSYYRRDFVSKTATPIALDAKVANRWSLLFLPQTFTKTNLLQLEAYFASHPEILPARMPY